MSNGKKIADASRPVINCASVGYAPAFMFCPQSEDQFQSFGNSGTLPNARKIPIQVLEKGASNSRYWIRISIGFCGFQIRELGSCIKRSTSLLMKIWVASSGWKGISWISRRKNNEKRIIKDPTRIGLIQSLIFGSVLIGDPDASCIFRFYSQIVVSRMDQG